MTDEKSDRFDELLQDAALTYNRPPDERHMPLAAMWDAIDAQSFPSARRTPRYAQWLRVAAALIVGVGIGRVSLSVGRHQPASAADSMVAQAGGGSSGIAEMPPQSLDPATSRYLGQAAALLIALLVGPEAVLLTAGASAPENLVQNLVAWLRQNGFNSLEEVELVEEDVHFSLPGELQAAAPRLTTISLS